MSIREQEDMLFKTMKAVEPKLVTDGVVEESSYLLAKYKIVFVLKEVNGGENWDLREFLRGGGRSQTWDNVARWTEGLLNLEQNIQWEDLEQNNEQRRNTYLKKICALNLKKTSGSYTADHKIVALAAQTGRNYLKQQFSFYNADIVVCCGTEKPFLECIYEDSHIEWKRTSRGIWYTVTDRIIIAFAHPASRTKDCFLYYALIDAVREILMG
ncbi:hypothetical protein Ami103574_09300 [Aminipila butyrica]|uniref:Uncharacterized protein n=1 Tax=Aminipila butyrica TaxID=433296 RepID=A0A858BVR1_9FIRM|nr:hypothetical protein [Aminipila butyrica]QIB69512.1 hypothetical protein Ami103574_09300 [Aminipila butyrica]